MTALVLVKLLAALISVALAAGILARDPELRVNRLIAALLLCNAWWASTEFFLYQETDVATALRLYRAMTLGWLPLGVLCMHASLALSSMDDHPIARSAPFFYLAVGSMLPFAMATGFVISAAEPTVLGWRPTFGPGFAIAYALLVTPVIGTLACWRGVMSLQASGGQVQLARIVFFGLSGALVAGTITAVIMPLLGIPAFGLTTTLIALVGLAAGVTLRRYGHSLISPHAFAREILDTLDDGVVLVGEGGIVRDVNRTFLRLVDATDFEVVGRPLSDWVSGLPAELHSTSTTSFAEIATRSGESVPVVVSPPVACHGSGRPVGRAYVFRDRREVLTLQRRLAVSARLAAVGDLSKSIARSIEEPVGRTRAELGSLARDWRGLLRCVEGLPSRSDWEEEVNEGLELIEECAEGVGRISSIVNEVGSFSSDRTVEVLEPHDLREIVRHALRIARVQAPDGLEIVQDFGDESMVSCHRPQIERVVTNLLVNALQAIEPDRPSTLRVEIIGLEDRVRLRIEDEGCGIEADVLDRIFDPFFTTKPVGKGTGLGLAISYHIVKDHGGELRVSSIAGRGTTVIVELPRAPETG